MTSALKERLMVASAIGPHSTHTMRADNVVLYEILREDLLPYYPHVQSATAIHRDFRAGDVRHSLADISKAKNLLGYTPTHRIDEGLKDTTN